MALKVGPFRAVFLCRMEGRERTDGCRMWSSRAGPRQEQAQGNTGAGKGWLAGRCVQVGAPPLFTDKEVGPPLCLKSCQSPEQSWVSHLVSVHLWSPQILAVWEGYCFS